MPLIAALTPAEYEIRHTDEIVATVRFDQPADLVGLTAPTPSARHAYALAREFRVRRIPLVIGGPHATALPEETLEHADAVVVGEAEDTWPRVLADAARGTLGGIYRSSGTADLAGMPAPRWDLIQGRPYGRAITIASRGCPHRCDYCTIPLLYGPGRVRYRPVEEIAAEVAGSPTRAVVFWDDNLGANPRYARNCSGPSHPCASGGRARTLTFLERTCVDAATVSMVVPMPGTPLFHRLEAEGRILTRDWSRYDGKRHCVFRPTHMTPDQLVAGTEWVARRFYSLRSIGRRLAGSRTGVWWNLPRNLGYHLALGRGASRGWSPAGHGTAVLEGRAGGEGQ